MPDISRSVADTIGQASRPVLMVERSDGAKTDLFRHMDGKLYTRPHGGGDEVSTWSAGLKLLVERFYLPGQFITAIPPSAPAPPTEDAC